MLTHFGNVPDIKIIFDPEPPFVMEAFATFYNRGVDPPVLRGGELFDDFVVREEFDDSLAHALGSEGPYWRSFLLILRVAWSMGCFDIRGDRSKKTPLRLGVASRYLESDITIYYERYYEIFGV